MKTIILAAVGAAAFGLSAPAMAAGMPMHHHHGKKMMMKSKVSDDDAETAKLNDDSLMHAKSGASQATTTTPGDTVTPPVAGPIPAAGTGVAAPSSGTMGHTVPGAAPSTPK